MDSSDQSSRPNFLAAIRSLKLTLRRPLRVKPQQSEYETSESSQSSSDLSSDSSRNSSQHAPSTTNDYYAAPRRQGVAPDMDDYLSLDQLEGLWQFQDSYVGPVATPLTASRFQYQEAVEAPTYVQHKRPDNSSIPRGNSASNLGVTGSDEALMVDGRLHPAMRSTPDLSSAAAVTTTATTNMEETAATSPTTMERDLPPPPKDITNLPPPPPMPINRSRIANDFPRLSSIGKPLVSKSGKPVLSKMGKPVPIPMQRPATSWTSRRQLLREEPGLI